MDTPNYHFVYPPTDDVGTHKYKLFTIWVHLAVAMCTRQMISKDCVPK